MHTKEEKVHTEMHTDEVAPHRKKSKTASKSNSSKRADHKHDYEKVVLQTWFGWEWGKRCKICGRIDSFPFNYLRSTRDDFLRPEVIERGSMTLRDFLSIEEIRKKFPDARIFIMDESVPHSWCNYKEVE